MKKFMKNLMISHKKSKLKCNQAQIKYHSKLIKIDKIIIIIIWLFM